MNAVPDKSFMQIPRKEKFNDNRYAEGDDAFLNYAEQDVNRSLSGTHQYCLWKEKISKRSSTPYRSIPKEKVDRNARIITSWTERPCTST